MASARQNNLSVTMMHGVMDYLTAGLLMAAPWLFGFADHATATMTTVAFGAGILVYSLLTNYELGALRKIPMSAHLLLDAVGGALLIASPFLFGFADRVWVPHLVVGIVEAAVTGATAVALGLMQVTGTRRGGGRRAAY